METKIILYNNSVSIITQEESLTRTIERFVKEFYTRPVDEEKNYEFVGHCAKRYEYTFLNEQFSHFFHFCKLVGYNIGDCLVVDKKDFDTPDPKYKLQPSRKLRDYQEEVKAFCVEDQTNLKFLPLTMGRGKTILALNIAEHKKQRVMFLVEAFLVPKWKDDILLEHVADPKDIAMVCGKDRDPDGVSMQVLTNAIVNGELDPKYFVISMDSFYNFVKEYEAEPDECVKKYGCTPMEFLPKAGIGTLVSDETHLSFFSVFMCLLYCNAKFTLGMSATLIHDQAVDALAMKNAFPIRTRYHTAMRKKYINFIYATYTIERDALKKIRFTTKMPGQRGMDVYNHVVFEQSIMKNKLMLHSYMDIVKELIDEFYFDVMTGPEDKLLIFVASVAMASELTKELKKCLPSKKIARYVQADKYEDMIRADIIVSTNQSVGVGITIPNLITGIQSVVVTSEKRNLQASGRLRELENKEVRYVCMYSEQLRKHLKNIVARKQMFKDFAINIDNVRSSMSLSLDKHRRPYKFNPR